MEPKFVASFWTLAGNSHPRTCNGISILPLEERAAAAAEAGFYGFSFVDTDLTALRETSRWHAYADIRRLMESTGFKFIEVELITNWFATGERKKQSDQIRDMLFEAAAELGANHIKVVGDFADEVKPAQMVDSFGELSRLAAKAGVKLGIELTPLTNLITPDQALTLVRDSRATNAGVFLDVWHMGRGGVDMESLDQIPGDLIIGVELDDADIEQRGSLMDDTMTHRRFPGEGGLEPWRLIAAVLRAGYKGPYGIEVISDDQRKMPVKDVARKAIETSRAQFELAQSYNKTRAQ